MSIPAAQWDFHIADLYRDTLQEILGNVEVMQLDFEMENFTSLSVTRRINWNIDYKGQNPPADSEKVVTELTVVQRDIQAILPLAMRRRTEAERIPNLSMKTRTRTRTRASLDARADEAKAAAVKMN
ncbi:unnamed protein product [Merluccius merluccius]